MEKEWQRISERIAERTGLKTVEDIEAYSNFCIHSDMNDGVIMYGDVQHEFYTDLKSKASEPMNALEEAYNAAKSRRKKRFSEETERGLRSPLDWKANKEFNRYFGKFVCMDLISMPEKFGNGFTKEFYSKLKGYNYFNDPQFYRARGNERTLII